MNEANFTQYVRCTNPVQNDHELYMRGPAVHHAVKIKYSYNQRNCVKNCARKSTGANAFQQMRMCHAEDSSRLTGLACQNFHPTSLRSPPS